MIDIGCGDKPYEDLFYNVKKYEGIEIETSVHTTTKADYVYDGITFPFTNESYDSIILNEVIEHVFNPDELLQEIRRIMKPEATMMITLPFVWDEHEQPYDYARYSSFGIKHLLQKNGFKVEVLEKSCPNFGVIFQLVNGYIYKITKKLPLIFRMLFILLLCFPFTILGLILGSLLPNNNDLYLDNILIVSKSKF